MPSARSIAASLVAATLFAFRLHTPQSRRRWSARPLSSAPSLRRPAWVGSAIGRDLDEKDTATAIAAQQEAVNSGAPARVGRATTAPMALSCRDRKRRRRLSRLHP